MTTKIYLPDTLAHWRWPRRINPHYLEVKEEAAAWIASFRVFSPKAQRAFDLCDFKHLRTGCDFMNLLLLFDESSDVEDAAGVQLQADIIMDALCNPHKPRPAGEWIGGEIFRQFWERAIKTASPQSQKRLVNAFSTYTQSMVQQAADRSHAHIRDIDSYLQVRRETVATKPAFALFELDMDLPDEVVNHPVIQDLSIWAADMHSLANDMLSYNVEQARGDDAHNIVTVVMNQLKTDIAGAMTWVEGYHKELERKFNEHFDKVPQWGGLIDVQVALYMNGVGNSVRANDQWCFESKRYFGNKGLEILKTRYVTLMPKTHADEMGPQVIDDSVL
ncbi:hypothetical protein HETIRDRAFT_51706 [Heterobasidion irregulare TC 32-1]|uniref:Terpene synthase n=1 Tax=Heterobasidion irregulare (strain TC 32-1) TaxID=747525 RepID=W4K6J5_HETIT|nr:uncharacterized protein HETIRDRAFT_51706 [Heterobasidion irregulare TC 32-1]ETW81359.1 hypothetical protein HETIRDRAFT_51706 [Heterobasidion irregulare TC 32-1]